MGTPQKVAGDFGVRRRAVDFHWIVSDPIVSAAPLLISSKGSRCGPPICYTKFVHRVGDGLVDSVFFDVVLNAGDLFGSKVVGHHTEQRALSLRQALECLILKWLRRP